MSQASAPRSPRLPNPRALMRVGRDVLGSTAHSGLSFSAGPFERLPRSRTRIHVAHSHHVRARLHQPAANHTKVLGLGKLEPENEPAFVDVPLQFADISVARDSADAT